MTLSRSMPQAVTRFFFTAALAATAFISLNGCGGSNNGNTGSQVKIRSLDLCSNGGTATIFINNGSTNGTQSFEQASGYLFLNGGNSTFTFTLGSQPDTGYPTVTQNLVSGDYYSVILFGNANVANQATRGYPFLSIQQDDRTAPATGNARVRIVHAAPDAGAVDVHVGSQSVATDYVYGLVGVGAAPSTGSPTTTYEDVPAGNETIQVDATGTTAPLFTGVPVTLAAGHLYTISLVETTLAVAAAPTATPPTAAVPAVYTVILTDDGT